MTCDKTFLMFYSFFGNVTVEIIHKVGVATTTSTSSTSKSNIFVEKKLHSISSKAFWHGLFNEDSGKIGGFYFVSDNYN